MIMSPAEWLITWGDHQQIEQLQWRLSNRKERLFLAACCRQVLHLVPEEPCRLAVEAAEVFADGQISDRKLCQARRAANAVYRALWDESQAARISHPITSTPTSRAANLMVHARCLAAEACKGAVMTRYSLAWRKGQRATWDACHAATVAKYYDALVAAPEEAFATPPYDCWEEKAAEAAYDQARLAATRPQVEVLFDILGDSTRPVSVDPAWLAWHDGTVARMAAAIYDERDWSILPLLADVLEDAGCAYRELLEHLRGPGPHVLGCWALDVLLGLT
jgi:hypothetical protein